MTDIKEIIKKYPTVGNLDNEKGLDDLLKNTEKLFQEVSTALSVEISGIRSNPLYNAALSAAFQVASNALMQSFADKDYLQAIREMLLSTAFSISTIKKVKRDE